MRYFTAAFLVVGIGMISIDETSASLVKSHISPKLVPNSYGCWATCGQRGGFCPKQCGVKALCCKKGDTDCPKNVAAANPARRHACVAIGYKWGEAVAPKLVPKSYGCWAKCGHKGGFCPKQCGTNALCCRKGYSDCPKHLADVNPSSRHACIKIGHPLAAPLPPSKAASVYLVVKRGLSWANAQKACNRWGGHLAVINSKAENDHILGLLRAKKSNRGWIGYNDNAKEGSWKWIGGSSHYKNWRKASREPNGGRTENCGEMLSPWNGLWNDSRCHHKYPSICEKAEEGEEDEEYMDIHPLLRLLVE